jgi:hypothetical protein
MPKPISSADAVPRTSKAQKTLFISFLLDMIAQNSTRNQCVNALAAKFSISTHQGYKYFIEASEQLESDLHDKVSKIRYRRIHALNKDIQDAYKNYIESKDPSIKVKWYTLYFNLKNQLDNYYPNALKPVQNNEELNISIVYNKIKALDK